MKMVGKLTVALLLLILCATVYAKAITYKIVVRSESLGKPLVIGDDEIVSQFKIWAGPNSRRRDSGGEWQTDYNGAFIDFEAGFANRRPSGLVEFDIEFHLMDYQSGSYWDDFFVAKYALHPDKNAGFFYLPTGRSSTNTRLVYHGVEGNWLHSSDLWEASVAPLIRKALQEAE